MQRRVDVQHHRRRARSSPSCAATPRRAPRRSPPTARPASPRRRVGTCDTASSPTPPTRTDRAAHADARCRRTPRRRRRASTSPAPAPCPDHAAGPAHRVIGIAADNESPSPNRSANAPKSVQPDMGDDLVAATFHHHRDRAVTVHLASALQARDSDASTTSESLTWRALPRMGNPQLTKPRERSGLGDDRFSSTRCTELEAGSATPAGVVLRCAQRPMTGRRNPHARRPPPVRGKLVDQIRPL